MSRLLIPRSDNTSAKTIEASDWEKYFPSDVLRDYVKTGLTATVQNPNILAVDIGTGTGRVKGLYFESTLAETVTGLTACATNYIYATLCRDPTCEPQLWTFTKNTTGSIPIDSVLVARAITNATTVTSVDQTGVITTPTNLLCVTDLKLAKSEFRFGDGSDGCVTINNAAGVDGSMQYNNLTINATKSLTSTSGSTLVIKVKNTLTVAGTIHMDGKASTGSNAGGTGGDGGSGGNSSGSDGTAATELGVRSFGINAAGGAGGLGGDGGDESACLPGGSGAVGSGVETNVFVDNRIQSAYSVISSLPVAYGGGGGAGGGAGGGGKGSYSGTSGTGGAGGLGGDGGGTLIIIADTITINSGGLISANGGTGAVGGTGGAGSGSNVRGGGGGGSGGGGAGGLVILVYKTLTNNGSVTVTGGAGGTIGSGTNGGTNGTAGSSGSAGVFKSFQIT